MVKKILFLVLISIVGILIYDLFKPPTCLEPDPILATKIGIKTLESAIKMYKLDNEMYPSTEQGLVALIKKPTLEPIPSNWRKLGYLDDEKSLDDPWGNRYIYRCPGKNHEYEILTLGEDKKPGGEGYDKDLYNWDFE